MAEGWEPFGIVTEAGKKLFIYMNMHYGSGVWGRVGEGIVEVEKEVTERIIALLNEMLADNWDWAEDCDCDGCIRINKMFALIKAES
jgi:hypothetical protein